MSFVTSTDFSFPRTWQPAFPTRCPGCGAPAATGEILLAGGGDGDTRSGLVLVATDTRVVRFEQRMPGCRRCASRTRWWALRRGVVLCVTALGVDIAVAALLRVGFHVPLEWALWTGVAAACAATAWVAVRRLRAVPPVTVRICDRWATYRFRDLEYRVEFERLNRHLLEEAAKFRQPPRWGAPPLAEPPDTRPDWLTSQAPPPERPRRPTNRRNRRRSRGRREPPV